MKFLFYIYFIAVLHVSTANKDIKPNDSTIQYIGRFAMENPDSYVFSWPGT